MELAEINKKLDKLLLENKPPNSKILDLERRLKIYSNAFEEEREKNEKLQKLCNSQLTKIEELEKELSNLKGHPTVPTLQQEKAKNLEITGSLQNQIQLEGAQIADLLNILQSNHSYQENLKLKDKISELETDLKWYKEKDEYRNVEGAIEKMKLEGPEDKSDKKDDESEDSWTSWEDEEKSKSGDSFSDMDDIKGYGIFD
ncbi:hypothetical protein L5515_012475 [Caenorhabditis briggsae]|uniref:Uncharacterized protein n=1 Tax=Caenorhabditis briggsae TaxID=6238 RepID=A0AAE9EXP6_CAEBR|nr:hypothetical protein L5515_012475 [Caenorhabditis briggsae]